MPSTIRSGSGQYLSSFMDYLLSGGVLAALLFSHNYP
jgi:hypothetical protein